MANQNEGNLGVAFAPQSGQQRAADQQSATVRYVDRPECMETFADSVSQLYFDGQSLRIEFAVTRLDEIKPNTPITGRRYPAQRVVLTPLAAADLINRMQQVATALAQAGLLKTAPPQPTPPPRNPPPRNPPLR